MKLFILTTILAPYRIDYFNELGKLCEHLIQNKKLLNAKIIKTLSKDGYDQLLRCCDVGLIFLDHRFTIPNYPSRLTAYMESAMPILAATDVNTDIKDVLREVECGMWAESGDLTNFKRLINELANDKIMRKKMGFNGRKYLEKNYTVSRGYEIITAHFKDDFLDNNRVQ